jgi:hypothetical protein
LLGHEQGHEIRPLERVENGLGIESSQFLALAQVSIHCSEHWLVLVQRSWALALNATNFFKKLGVSVGLDRLKSLLSTRLVRELLRGTNSSFKSVHASQTTLTLNERRNRRLGDLSNRLGKQVANGGSQERVDGRLQRTSRHLHL